jgi:1-phosphatidylinositol-4-phosphate 5-kinase
MLDRRSNRSNSDRRVASNNLLNYDLKQEDSRRQSYQKLVSKRINIKATFESFEDSKFEKLMRLDNIKPEDVLKSLSLEANRHMVFKAGEGAGKSGSFFFFSFDKRFIIKTMKGNEKQKLLNMLDDYINHIVASKNKSILARIYGVFTIKSNYFDPLDILIMQNTALVQEGN